MAAVDYTRFRPDPFNGFQVESCRRTDMTSIVCVRLMHMCKERITIRKVADKTDLGSTSHCVKRCMQKHGCVWNRLV